MALTNALQPTSTAMATWIYSPRFLFFPGYDKSPEESFLYLQNEGGMKFSAHTLPSSYEADG
jgi:hypothetical protein